MKVFCIEDNMPVAVDFYGRIPPQPNFGDIDTVIYEGAWDKNDQYKVEEYYCLQRFGLGIGYSKKHFIPLSEIDETELVNNNTIKEVNV